MATFTGTSGADVASATTGTLTGFTGGTVAQLQDGSGDTFVGAAGADVIVAGGGADTITGGAGADSLTGGLGADVFVLAAAVRPCRRRAINGTAEAGTIDTLRLNAAGIYDLSTFTTITNIDQVAFNQNAAGFVLTLADSQVATANANGDAVQGDLSITASLAMTNGVTVNAAGLTGSNRIVVVGTNLGGADSITGGAGDDTIDAGAGADVIVAGGGVDTITGGAGADSPDRRARRRRLRGLPPPPTSPPARSSTAPPKPRPSTPSGSMPAAPTTCRPSPPSPTSIRSHSTRTRPST